MMWTRFKEWLGYHVHDWQWGEPAMRKIRKEVRFKRDDSTLFGVESYYDPHLQDMLVQKGKCNKCGMATWREVRLED